MPDVAWRCCNMHLSITGNSSEAGQPPALQSVRVNRDTGLDDTASLSQRASSCSLLAHMGIRTGMAYYGYRIELIVTTYFPRNPPNDSV